MGGGSFVLERANVLGGGSSFSRGKSHSRQPNGELQNRTGEPNRDGQFIGGRTFCTCKEKYLSFGRRVYVVLEELSNT